MHPSPLVVAHRGSSHRHAEHTLTAYTSAIEEGADALECDVRLTADGHLVCVHDRKVNRTSDGRGIVSEKSLADLNDLDFASWHATQQDPLSADELVLDDDSGPEPGVLTLATLIETVLAAPRLVRLFVETKHPTRYGGLVEQQLVRELRRYGLDKPADREESVVIAMSFAPMAMRRVRLLAPDLPTMLLAERVPPFRRDGSLPPGVDWAGPGLHILRTHPRYVERVHDRGGKLYVWTVDDAPDIEHVLSLGVDAVATNRPHDVLTKIGRT